MSAFAKIIGYENVKKELRQVADMIKNPDKYKAFGAKMPKGIILHGVPGVGKTMLAAALIEEAGVNSKIIRHEMARDSFCNHIKTSFKELAASGEPAIILLDDLDKFSTDEKNEEEFAVVQACIDSVKDNNIFVVATVNDMRMLPKSLTRSGRFDRNVEIGYPVGEEATKIIMHYMEGVKVAPDINYEDIAKMLTNRSCATLASVINAAAIEAAFAEKENIEMEDFVKATLTDVYGLENHCGEMSPEKREEIAYHEAGHAVLAEVLMPECIGMVSLSSKACSGLGGFVLRCKEPERRAYEILVALGGKAACEMKYGRVGSGTGRDLERASDEVLWSITRVATLGLSHFELNSQDSEAYLYGRQQVVAAELERYLFKAKEIVASNREFLDKVAKELIEKHTLLFSDMKRIRESCTIIPAIVG